MCDCFKKGMQDKASGGQPKPPDEQRPSEQAEAEIVMSPASPRPSSPRSSKPLAQVMRRGAGQTGGADAGHAQTLSIKDDEEEDKEEEEEEKR